MSPKPLKNVESRETKGQIVNYKNSQGVCVCVCGGGGVKGVLKIYSDFHWLGVFNIKHNLAGSCFQFWLSKSAPRKFSFRALGVYQRAV